MAFRLNQLRIGTRIWMGFGATLLALACTLTAARVSFWRADAQAAVEAADQQAQALAASVLGLAKDGAVDSLQMLVSPSPDQQKKLVAQVTSRNAELARGMEALAALVKDDADAQALLADARKRSDTYAAGARRIGELVIAGKQSEASFAADEEMMPMMAPFFSAVVKLAEHQQRRLEMARAESKRLSHQTQLVITCVGLAGLAMGLWAAYALARSITRPLAKAMRLVREVGSGDLSRRLPVYGRDELAELVAEMNQMSDRLSEVIGGVRAGSESVAASSAQIAMGNQDLSSRTDGQVSALQQTASSMERLDGAVRQTSENAEQAHRLADEACAAARAGGSVVESVVRTMGSIQEGSRRIGDITGVIDSIAFQTNILALNAAVEAARAGEQGRGFAVVAAEVRLLAKRSAEAAREIKGLIDTSVERVKTGTAEADRAGAAMGEIVTAIERVTQIVNEIANASRGQSEGVSVVGQAMVDMERNTQQNAALVEESAAAAEGLRTQAAQLAEAVARFKLAAA